MVHNAIIILTKNIMKEQEYIDVKTLAQIQAAKMILIQIIPDNSPMIDPKEHAEVLRLILKWEIEHFDKIKIN